MDDLAARVAVMESKQFAQELHNKRIETKVDAMYDVIMKLQGAKYLGWFLAAAAGYVISYVVPFMNGGSPK